MQTCARANRRLARLPQGFVREDLRVPLRSRTPSWPSCWAASETVLIIQLRTFWCEQFGRARGLWRAVSGAGPRDLASAISRVFFGVRSSSSAFCESLSGASEDGNSVKLSRLTPETSITPPSDNRLGSFCPSRRKIKERQQNLTFSHSRGEKAPHTPKRLLSFKN